MDNETLSIYDGKEFVYKESKYKYISKCKLLWRYGFRSLWNLDQSLSKMIKDFVNIYDLQDDGESYRYFCWGLCMADWRVFLLGLMYGRLEGVFVGADVCQVGGCFCWS